jgi:predicted GNAT superfamily acetyltransferase
MIRPGEAKDLEQLMAMSARLRDESLTMRDISIDEAKLRSVYARAFDPADEKVSLFVYERNGVIEGGMLGFIAEYYFSRERYAADLFLYVSPQCRRGLMSGIIARRLYERFRDWSVARGVREVRMGVSTGIAIECAHRFYMSLGMTHIGGHYSLPIVR